METDRHKKYRQSENGKAAAARSRAKQKAFRQTEAGKAQLRRWNQSDKGKAAAARYYRKNHVPRHLMRCVVCGSEFERDALPVGTKRYHAKPNLCCCAFCVTL